MSIVTDAFNKAEAQNPNLELSDFVKTFNAGSSPPPASSSPATSSAPVITGNGYSPRDDAKEKAVQQKLGMSDAQLMKLQNNPVFKKRLYDMAYANPQDIEGYNELANAEQGIADVGTQMQETRESAPNAMLALEEALRAKQDVGKQELGQSELFKKAGLDGFFTLNQSLADQSKIMADRYGSFINHLSRAGQYQTNKYHALASSYKALTDDYNVKAKELNSVLDNIQKYNDGINLAEQKLKNDKSFELWKRGLEAGEYDTTALTKNQKLFDTGQIRSSQTSDTTGMNIVNASDPNGDNCVLYARAKVPNLPYGLFSAEDKKKAVQKAGYTDSSKVQIGDAVLTGEGGYGHVAIVTGIDGNSLILDEANYKSGKITTGRKLNKNDRSILGFVSPTSGPQASIQVSENTDTEGTNTSIEQDIITGKSIGYGAKLQTGAGDGGGITAQDKLKATQLTTELTKGKGDTKYKQDIADNLLAERAAGKTWDQIQDAWEFADFNPNFKEYMNGAVAGAYRMISLGKLDTRQRDQFQFTIDNATENKSDSKVRDTLKKAAKSSLGVTERQILEGQERTSKLLDDIEKDLKEYVRLSGDTGLFVGTFEAVTNKIGKTYKGDLARIGARIANSIQTYRRSMSGVAFSVPESAEYTSMFPSVAKETLGDGTIDGMNGLNINLIKGLKQNMDFLTDESYKMAMGDENYYKIYGGADHSADKPIKNLSYSQKAKVEEDIKNGEYTRAEAIEAGLISE